jgi:hypothetical protein
LTALVSYWFTQKYKTNASIHLAKDSPRRVIIGEILTALVSYWFTQKFLESIIIGDILEILKIWTTLNPDLFLRLANMPRASSLLIRRQRRHDKKYAKSPLVPLLFHTENLTEILPLFGQLFSELQRKLS